MDKSAIKKYAMWARTELIRRVSQKAEQFNISADANPNADNAHGVVLTEAQKKQRAGLIGKMKKHGQDQIIEEVAYTWFNRFIALRFMEVNNYLPSRIRVFTDEDNNFKPQIISEAIHLELDGLDQQKVYDLKQANDDENLFKYLILAQCNALSSVLPRMFQKIDDDTELLFPDNLLREGSVIEQMIELIPEEDWKDQVQIIGWLYQYYNTEPKDRVFADLKKNIKITKDKIPAATQLFTPDWIVRYMVENSLGRFWLDGHPEKKSQFLPTKEEQDHFIQTHEEDEKWHYYVQETEQDPDADSQLDRIRNERAELQPEQIRVIDPCCGSGHILCRFFDVFVQIYTSYGIQTRYAVRNIVENNLWGLDIDERAAQLSYFSVMMKAVQYDPRFLRRKNENGELDIPQPNVFSIHESNYIDPEAIEYVVDGNPILKKSMQSIVNDLHDAKEYGSIIKISPIEDIDLLYKRLDNIQNQPNIYQKQIENQILPLLKTAQTLLQKYDVVVTNPPYMGIGGMGKLLQNKVKTEYPNAKYDLSTVFMEKTIDMCKENGYMSMINIPAWMFLTSFQKMRENLLRENTIVNMVHPGRGIFGSDFGTTTFVIQKSHIKNYIGEYRRLFAAQGEVKTIEERERAFLSGKGKYSATQEHFYKLPGTPVAYWVSESIIKTFDWKNLSSILITREGMATADNDRFLRYWEEVQASHIVFNCPNEAEFLKINGKWVPYNKGGNYRKWYGNNEYVVNWENGGYEIKHNEDPITHRIRSHNYNGEYAFREGITWTELSNANISVRFSPAGYLFDSKGAKGFSDEDHILYVLGLLNSCIAMTYLKFLSPTLDYKVGNILQIPAIYTENDIKGVNSIVKENIEISKDDWDSFETSWDFKRHPLLSQKLNGALSQNEISDGKLSTAYSLYQETSNERFAKLKSNEENINRMFINIYGLQNELSYKENDNAVTIHYISTHKNDAPDELKNSAYLLTRQDVIKSFVSYSVGCMFGRYSLDEKGLVYAGGKFEPERYKKFPADKDNIIPITDDEYFPDDIVNRFISFVETVFGDDTIDENLRFIADALGGNGIPREVLRDYFLNDFFQDHCKTYQKRPIYWLFDAGKKNSFKCLVYMHRYQPDTIARIRTDYVHEQQGRYRTAIEALERQLETASSSDRARLNKKLEKLRGQAEELRIYEEKIHHLADQMISIDLDDGVKHNYAIFQDVLAKIK